MELFDLKDQVAIVTGSSRGIGRAIAQRLAEHGARVVISSRKLAPCQEVADAINARHGATRAMAVAANISSKTELQHLVDATRAQWGRIDVLVCNAASNPYYGPMTGISDEAFEKIFRNNVLSNHWLVQLVAPGMIETDMSKDVRQLAGDEILSRILLKRYGTVQDIANAVLFMASDLSSYSIYWQRIYK